MTPLSLESVEAVVQALRDGKVVEWRGEDTQWRRWFNESPLAIDCYMPRYAFRIAEPSPPPASAQGDFVMVPRADLARIADVLDFVQGNDSSDRDVLTNAARDIRRHALHSLAASPTTRDACGVGVPSDAAVEAAARCVADDDEWDDLSDDTREGLKEIQRHALAAAYAIDRHASKLETSSAVAWQWRIRQTEEGPGMWTTCERFPDALSVYPKYEIRALYTTPTPAGDLAADVGTCEEFAWADLPWRAATGWLRSASGSKIVEVDTMGVGISQRESELIAAAVNAYTSATPQAASVDAKDARSPNWRQDLEWTIVRIYQTWKADTSHGGNVNRLASLVIDAALDRSGADSTTTEPRP